jgi:hypothetical protein
MPKPVKVSSTTTPDVVVESKPVKEPKSKSLKAAAASVAVKKEDEVVVVSESVGDVEVPVVAPSAQKKSKAPSKKPVGGAAVQSKDESESVSVPVKVVEPLSEVDSSVPVEASVSTLVGTPTVNSIVSKVKAFMVLGADILRDVRALDKSHIRELKVMQKAGLKKKRKNTNYTPSGFIKPAIISDEMADFLGKPHGSLIPRTEVTKAVNAYIKEHQLQNTDKAKGGRRVILADKTLRTLFKISKERVDAGECHYFKLQSFLQPHFIKTVPVVPVVSPAVVSL